MPNLKKTKRGDFVTQLQHPLGMIVCVLLITACSRQVSADPSKKLEGSWSLKGTNLNGGIYQSTLVIGTNGLYVANISTYSASDMIVRSNRVSGIIQLKKDMFIDTITKHSNSNAVLPWTSRGRIIRFDDQEIVVEWEVSDHGELPSISYFRKMKSVK